MLKKKILANFYRIIEHFTQKLSLALKNMGLGSGIRKKPIPDPGYKFFCLLLFEDTFTSVFTNKNSERFSYFLCLMIEGSGSGWSGSGRSKNLRIRIHWKKVFFRSGSEVHVEIQNKLIWKKWLAWIRVHCILLCMCRVGPLLRQMGRTEALDWLIRETQPIGWFNTHPYPDYVSLFS
jgi:hypothetical protein